MTRHLPIILLAFALAACGRPTWNSDRPHSIPADFSLVFTVVAEGGNASDPLRMPSHYVLEADRTLRVALGPGAGDRDYPPATATLSPTQMQALYDILRDHLLPPQRTAAPLNAPVTYQITITSDGRRHRYLTTPDASPGARALLSRLIELRGGLPPADPGL